MNIQNLCMSFNKEIIFDYMCVIFQDTDRVGITGVNGAGKSTLFNLIRGTLTPDSGKILLNNKRIGYLPQVITDEIPVEEITVFDYLLEGRPIKKLENELNDIYLKISSTIDEKQLKIYYNKIDKIEKKLSYYDSYNAEGILLKIISGMNINDELLYQNLKSLSGGEKSKVAFVRLLYSKPEILLLDEPTNHLDLDTKDYIINYIKSYKGLVLVISHDISFLDEVTNKTLYINKVNHTTELFNGSYSKYLKVKNEKNEAKLKLYEKQQKEEEKLKKIISKYIRGNEKKANIAKDRIKKLERLQKEKVELERNNKYTRFKIKIENESYSIPISVNNLTFGYTDEELLYENLTFDLSRGEKFLIVGENGIGKTTLLKLLMNYLKPISGDINIGKKTTIGYYAQEHEILKSDKRIIDNFEEYNMPIYELRRFLGSFLFAEDDIYKKIEVLSPGERSRVALAKISLKGANTLLLDEPTNHLDPVTQTIIAETFKDYDGTMLVVSHNLDFVDNLGINRMLLLPSGRIVYYDRDIVLHYEMENENKE